MAETPQQTAPPWWGSDTKSAQDAFSDQLKSRIDSSKLDPDAKTSIWNGAWKYANSSDVSPDEVKEFLQNSKLDDSAKTDIWNLIYKGPSKPLSLTERLSQGLQNIVAGAPGYVAQSVKDYKQQKAAENVTPTARVTPPPTPTVPGLVQPGNISNLFDRPTLANTDPSDPFNQPGSYSTTSSSSFTDERPGSPTFGREVLIPTVVDGKRLSKVETGPDGKPRLNIDAAKEHYYQTGEHLGVFDTPENADAYAGALHNAQASLANPATVGFPNQLKQPVLQKPPLSKDQGRSSAMLTGPPPTGGATGTWKAAGGAETDPGAWDVIKQLPHNLTADVKPQDIYGSLVKMGAGLIHGLTLGYYDPESGSVNIPLTHFTPSGATQVAGKTQLRDRSLSDILQQDWGVDPAIAKMGTADSIGDVVGSSVPWSAISRTLGGAINIVRAAKTTELAADGVKPETVKTVYNVVNDILKNAGIQAGTGAIFATLEKPPDQEQVADKAKRIGETALYGAAFSMLFDSFAHLLGAAFPGAQKAANKVNETLYGSETADKIVNDIYDIFERSGRFSSPDQARAAADRTMRSTVEKYGKDIEQLSHVREAAERRFTSEAEHAGPEQEPPVAPVAARKPVTPPPTSGPSGAAVEPPLPEGAPKPGEPPAAGVVRAGKTEDVIPMEGKEVKGTEIVPKAGPVPLAQMPEDSKMPSNSIKNANPNDVIRGWKDIPLSEAGKQQVQELAQNATGAFDTIYSGHLGRHAETAQALASTNPNAVVQSPDQALSPWHSGLQGQKTIDVLEKMNYMVQDAPDTKVAEAEPGLPPPESFNEFVQRGLPPFQSIYQQWKEAKQAGIQPPHPAIVVSFRNVKLLQAAVKKGFPQVNDVDNEEMLRKDGEPGSVERWVQNEDGTTKTVNVDPTKPDAFKWDDNTIAYVIRHGLTEWNGEDPAGRQGQSPKTPSGAEESVPQKIAAKGAAKTEEKAPISVTPPPVETPAATAKTPAKAVTPPPTGTRAATAEFLVDNHQVIVESWGGKEVTVTLRHESKDAARQIARKALAQSGVNPTDYAVSPIVITKGTFIPGIGGEKTPEHEFTFTKRTPATGAAKPEIPATLPEAGKPKKVQAPPESAIPDKEGQKPAAKTVPPPPTTTDVALPSSSPEAPPGKRWTGDRGAMPGEPAYFLDVENDDTDTAKAVIVVNDKPEKGGLTYSAYANDGRNLGEYSSITEAGKNAEAWTDQQVGRKPKVSAPPAGTGQIAGNVPPIKKGVSSERPSRVEPPPVESGVVHATGAAEAQPAAEGDGQIRGSAGLEGEAGASGPAAVEGQGPESGSTGGTAGRGAVRPKRAPGPGRGVDNSSFYRITDADQIGSGGATTKFRDNIKAIRILKSLMAEGRLPTDEERKSLVRYVGWGGLSEDAFNYYNRDTRPLAEELEKLLTPEEYEDARASVKNAHFTSIPVVRFMWSLAQRMGFKTGTVVEPAMGVGHFFGTAPADILSGSAQAQPARFIGVELDPTTGNIAKYLYPGADIRIRGYETVMIPDNSVDFFIGNVPFGDYKLHDPRYKDAKLLIHDYFFVKSLDKVRPGGLVMFITSKGTLDKANPRVRELMASKADLVAAYRLPNDAFSQNARTQVTTDVIILKKRADGTVPAGYEFLKTVNTSDAIAKYPALEQTAFAPDIHINEYFVAHPHHMLGKMTKEGSMYRGDEATLSPTRPLQEMMDEVLKAAPQNVMDDPGVTANTSGEAAAIDRAAPDEVKELAYVVSADGEVLQRINGLLVEPRSAAVRKAKDQTISFVNLRDQTSRVITTQMSSADDDLLKPELDRLNEFYDKHVKKYGHLNRPENALFADDPQFPLLKALEDYDKETGAAKKTDIFRKRTIRPAVPLSSVSPKMNEAMLQILSERGYPDIPLLSKLTGMAEEATVQALEAADLVYKDPHTGEYQTPAIYLSGRVREKLTAARLAAEQDPAYQRNVDALEKVQPVPVSIDEIKVKMGASWVPRQAYEGFIAKILMEGRGYQSSVKRLPDGSWKADFVLPGDLGIKWGTDSVSARDLVQDALNQKRPTVKWRDEEGRAHLDEPRTLAAREKLQIIKNEFSSWAQTDPQWAKELEAIYNREYNGIRLTEYNGIHLQLPGITTAITLRPHQLNAVQRIINDGRALIAHEVGTGKTFTAIAAGMELRRLGIAKKVMYVVPNGKVEQWREMFQRLYPSAKVLAVGKDDLAGTKRKTGVSRVATGDWDAVILQHSSFGLLPISNEYIIASIQKELQELEETLSQISGSSDYGSRGRSRGKSRDPNVKALEKAKSRLMERMQDLLDAPKDNTIKFDQLGVDYMFVDEAHEFKKLPFYTKIGSVSGLPSPGDAAKRSFDLKTKTDFLLKRNNGRGVIFLTGTPVSNTMAEVYNMTRYVAPDVFEKAGIQFFDDWAANFGDIINVMELSPDGRSYRARSKFAEFTNAPELLSMFRSFTDVKFAKDMDLPLPKLKGGRPTVVKVPTNDAIEPVFLSLVERAENLRKNPRLQREGVDNWLSITGDGKRVALDARLYNPILADHPNSKSNIAVRNVFELWKEGSGDKSAQVIFVDQFRHTDKSTGKVDFDLFKDMRDKLVKMGVPSKEIIFGHEFTSDEQLDDMQRKINSGTYRIVFATTAKLGVGINMQERLYALHDLEPPWRPDQLEQRHGRIMRQGNLHEKWGKEIEILQYVTEKSFDAYIFQALETKARFIHQIMSGEIASRTISDLASDVVLQYAELKAVASGNPDVKRKLELEMQINQLAQLKRAYLIAERERRSKIDENDSLAAGYRSRAASLTEARQLYEEYLKQYPTSKDPDEQTFKGTIDGQSFDAAKDLAEYVEANKEKVFATGNTASLYGVPVRFETVTRDHKELREVEGVRKWVTVTSTNFRYLLANSWHDVPETAKGLLQSIRGRLDDIPGDVNKLEHEIDYRQDQNNKIRGQLGKAFDKTVELQKLESELSEVNTRLHPPKQTEAENMVDVGDESVTEQGPEEESGPSEEGSASIALPKPMVAIANELKDVKDSWSAAFVPTQLGLAARDTGLVVRKQAATLAAEQLRAAKVLEEARNYFQKRTREQNLQFMFAIDEPGGPWVLSPSERQFANAMRELLDKVWGQVQNRTGTEAYIEDYFPRLFKDPEKAKEFAGRWLYGRRPLEGNKKFLKQRTRPTMRESIEGGLETIYENPVDMVMAQIFQENKFITAKDILTELKDLGIAHYIPSLHTARHTEGLARINDRIGEVWGPPTVQVKEAYDNVLFDALNEFARSMGIEHYRKAQLPDGQWGWSEATTKKIYTRFAGPESQITHEIGHQLDRMYGLSDELDKNKATDSELTELAKMRYAGAKGQTVTEKYKAYVQDKSERIANLIQALVHTPEIAERVAPTATRIMRTLLQSKPELRPLLDIKPSLVLGEQSNTVGLGGFVLYGNYWVPKDAARIINNYLSPGLAGNPVYDWVRYIGNFLNQVQLSTSAYHFTFTAIEDALTSASNALMDISRGHPIRAVKTAVRSPIAAFLDVIEGSRILKEFYAPGSQGEYYARIIGDVINAGGRFGVEQAYRNSDLQAFFDAWYAGRKLGALGHSAGAFMEWTSAWLMKHWIPRLKLAAFAQILARELAGVQETADPMLVRYLTARAWDEVDNRFGQMVYDNLFLHRTLKDLTMFAMRSPGWNIGSVRTLGGGALDIPNALLGRGEPYVTGNRRLTPRLAHLIMLPVVIGLMGALAMRLLTGKGPEEWVDYFYFKNGGLNPDGTESRSSFASYAKDLYAWGHEFPSSAVSTAAHKLHPLGAMALELIENRDYYGTEIRHPDDDINLQIQQLAKYVAGQYVPFSVRNAERLNDAKGRGMAVASFFGVTPAPRSVTDTKAVRLALQYQQDSLPQGARTQAQADRSRLKFQILSELRQNDPRARADIQEAIRQGKLGENDERLMRRDLPLNTIQRLTDELPLEKFMNVWDAATPKERDDLRPELGRKAKTLETMPKEDADRLWPRVRKALAESKTSAFIPPEGALRRFTPPVPSLG